MPPATDWGLRARLVLGGAVVLGYTALFAAVPAWLWGRYAGSGFPWVGAALLAVVLLTAQFLYGRYRTVGALDVPAADDRAASLEPAVDRLARQLDVPAPSVAVVDSPVPNATSRGGARNGTLVVTSRLLETLDDEGVEAVLAHEMAHLINRDTLLMVVAAVPSIVAHDALRRATSRPVEKPGEVTLGPDGRADPGNVLATVAVALPLGLLSVAVYRVFARYREFAADRAAARLVSPGALASALRAADGRIADLPRRDLRTAEGLAAVSFLPYGFEHSPVRGGGPGARETDWSSASGIEAIYDQPMRDREPDTGDSGPADPPLPRSHPDTRERIRRLESMAVEVEGQN